MAKVTKEKKRILQVPLSPQEDEILESLQRRFQEAVIARNKKTGEKRIANIQQTEIMRAGLLDLDEKKPDELREIVLAVIDEKKARAAGN